MADIEHPVLLNPVQTSEAFSSLSGDLEASDTISSDRHIHAISETVKKNSVRQKLTEIQLFKFPPNCFIVPKCVVTSKSNRWPQ